MSMIDRSTAGLIFVILSALMLMGCASTGGVRDQGIQSSAQRSLSIVRSATQEAKALPASAVIRIGNQYPNDGFMSLPDHLDGLGKLLTNQFASLPRGATCDVESESGEIVFTSTREPTVTTTRMRIVPSAGIVVKDYMVYWNGQNAKLKGIWVFVDDDGSVARVVSAKGQ